MLQQENSYLDSLLNHCTEINIYKKQKKDNETVGAHTAVLGLTNVSPQTNTTSSTNTWDLPMNMDFDDEEPAVTHVTSTLTTTHPNVSHLEQETKQQRQTIVHMEQQIQSLKRSVQELVKYKVQDKTEKQKFNEWQEGLDKQILAVRHNARENERAQTKNAVIS